MRGEKGGRWKRSDRNLFVASLTLLCFALLYSDVTNATVAIIRILAWNDDRFLEQPGEVEECRSQRTNATMNKSKQTNKQTKAAFL